MKRIIWLSLIGLLYISGCCAEPEIEVWMSSRPRATIYTPVERSD